VTAETAPEGPHGTAACDCPRDLCQRARAGLSPTGDPYQALTWDQLRTCLLKKRTSAPAPEQTKEPSTEPKTDGLP
jgi:hypothetical protein